MKLRLKVNCVNEEGLNKLCRALINNFSKLISVETNGLEVKFELRLTESQIPEDLLTALREGNLSDLNYALPKLVRRNIAKREKTEKSEPEAESLELKQESHKVPEAPKKRRGRKPKNAVAPAEIVSEVTEAPKQEATAPAPKKKPGRKPKNQVAPAEAVSEVTEVPKQEATTPAPKKKPGRKPKKPVELAPEVAEVLPVNENQPQLPKHCKIACFPSMPEFEAKLSALDRSKPVEEKVKYILTEMGMGSDWSESSQTEIFKVVCTALKYEGAIDFDKLYVDAGFENPKNIQMKCSTFVNDFLEDSGFKETNVKFEFFLADLKKII
jgi:hypothetical protein